MSNRFGTYVYSSTSNAIYDNVFVDNVNQTHDSSTNSWDNGYQPGGNYWSDYTGVDVKSGPNQDLPDSDGIVDTPYVISGGSNRDRYPLMSFQPGSVPTSPENFQANAGDGSITLIWSPPTFDGFSPILNYKICRGTTPGGETLLAEVGDVLTYSDTGLTNGQTYYYQVSAGNGLGEGPKSSEVKATPIAEPTIPSAPRNLETFSGNQKITLRWGTPNFDGGSAITSYRVFRGNAPGGETFLVQIGDVLTYIDTGLTNGQIYYYQVSAMNGQGEGGKSNEASATPSAGPTPSREG